MSKSHVIGPSESLVEIAYANGLFPDTIWEHPDNAALRAKRPNRNILMPGDVLVIPDKEPREWAGQTGELHRFRRKGVPHVFRLRLAVDDEPFKNEPYTLTVTGSGFEKVLKGVTDGDGVLTALIPPRAASGRIVISAGGDHEEVIDVLFGSLDPVEELTGVQKRLNNLGFTCPVDGVPGEQTTGALLAFQRSFGLSATGEPDAATREKLATVHEELGALPADDTEK